MSINSAQSYNTAEHQEPTLLFHGIEKAMEEIDFELENTPEMDKRFDLEEKKSEYEKIIASRKSVPKTEREAKECISGITQEQKAINALSSGNFKIQDIYYSDLKPFFQEKIEGQIRIAGENLEDNFRFRIEDLVNPISQERIWQEANKNWKEESLNRQKGEIYSKEWTKRDSRIQERINHLKVRYEAGEINEEEYLEKGAELARKCEEFQRKFREDRVLKHIQPDLVEGPSEEERQRWIEKEYERLLFEEAGKSKTDKILRNIPESTLRQIKEIFLEAQLYRIEALESYLEAEFGACQKALEKAYPKRRGDGFREAEQNLVAFFESYQEKKEEYIKDPEALRKFIEILRTTKEGLQKLAFENQEFEETRNDQTEELKVELNYVIELFEAIQKEKGTKEAEENLNQLYEIKKRLNGGSAVGVDEFSSMKNTILTLKGHLDRFAGNEEGPEAKVVSMDAWKARNTIAELAKAGNIEEAVNLVKKTMGEHHVEEIDNAEFEARGLDKYTIGAMVFYEAGEFWKIIINTDEINKADAELDEFKKQMTHELRHLEWDNLPESSEVKKKWMAILASPEWDGIQQIFVEDNPTKTPPGDFSGKKKYISCDWKKEDVLAELYAMRDQMENNPNDLLSQSVKGAGAPLGMYRGFTELGSDEEGSGIVSSEEDGGGIEYDKGDKVDNKDNDFKVSELQERLKAILAHEHIGKINGGKKVAKLISSALENNSGDAMIIEDATNDISEIEGILNDISTKIENKKYNFLRQLVNDSNFISISDIIRMGKDIKDFFSRRANRVEGQNAAVLTKAFLSGIPYFGMAAEDAEANIEKAEKEWVSEWQNRLDNKDAWQLWDIVDQMGKERLPNKDELKAIVRILADKGRLDWYDQRLWKVLNKLQKKEYFKPEDDFLMRNPQALRQKMMSAMGEMWDYEEFTSLDNKNSSSFESRKKDFKEAYNKMSGAVNKRMYDLLKRHKDGDQADPAEFEAILEYSIENGKSSSENVIFNIVVAMADGLLPPDRGIHLDKHLNLFPILDWFTFMDPPPSAKTFKNMCQQYFPDEYDNKKKIHGGQFQSFFWTHVLNNRHVIERTEKSAGPDAWDHDWSRGIAQNGGADTAERFLSGKSGQKATRPTAVQNAWAGQLQWFEENAKRPGSNWTDNVAAHIGWVAMADGIMENVAYRSNKIYTRKEAIIGGKKAREGGAGYHGNATVEQQRTRIRDAIDQLDPDFFKIIRDKSLADIDEGRTSAERAKEVLARKYGNDPDMMPIINGISKIDDVFKNISPIVQIIIKHNQNKLKNVRNILIDPKTNQVRQDF